MVSITFIFYGFFAQHNLFKWKVLPFGLATAPRDFTSLTKPILFLWHCMGFLLLYTCMIYWALLTPSMLARELTFSCAVFWFVLDYILIFLSWNSRSFLFWAYVGIQETFLSLCYVTNIMRCSSWFILCYRGNLLQFFRLCSFGQDHQFCQWSCTTLPVVPCHSEWHVEGLSLSHSFIFFFSLFLTTLYQLQKLL